MLPRVARLVIQYISGRDGLGLELGLGGLGLGVRARDRHTHLLT